MMNMDLTIAYEPVEYSPMLHGYTTWMAGTTSPVGWWPKRKGRMYRYLDKDGIWREVYTQ